MGKKGTGSLHMHKQSVSAQAHGRYSFPRVPPGKAPQPKHISDVTSVRLGSADLDASDCKTITYLEIILAVI
jgi:hypothetical protein